MPGQKDIRNESEELFFVAFQSGKSYKTIIISKQVEVQFKQLSISPTQWTVINLWQRFLFLQLYRCI